MTKEQYFNETVEKVLMQTGCTIQIDISILDHSTLKGKSKKALGCCHKFSDESYKITIDDYFVEECYEYFILNNKFSSWILVGKTLEQVICHELAHLREWRHGKRHTNLMNELINEVELPEQYYTYKEIYREAV